MSRKVTQYEEKKMNNKTCGDCKYFVLNGSGYCRSNDGQEDRGNDACSFFEPKVITNGDKIRQKTNEQFAIDYARYSKTHNLYVARLCPLSKQLWTTMEEAIQANLDYLNAPAESEVEE